MKIKFHKTTYIRSEPSDDADPPLGIMKKGAELEVDDVLVEGDEHQNSKLWYRDRQARYYWAGGAEIIEGPKDIPEEIVPVLDASTHAIPKTAWVNMQPNPKFMNWGLIQHQIVETFWKKHQLRGQGVKVALLDSGIHQEHPDLKPAIDSGQNLLREADEVGFQDLEGTGTQCAGIIAGRGEYKIFGVAPECRLHVGKIFSRSFQLDFEALLYGMKWATEVPVDIIFTSVNLHEAAVDSGQLHTLQSLLDTLDRMGILLIAPVGDSYSTYPLNHLPASIRSCLSVGAHLQNGTQLESCASSTSLDLLAPGYKLLTTSTPFETDLFSGSKAAAAYACGVAVLLKQYIKAQQLPISNQQLIDLLRETAYFVDPLQYYPPNTYGHGLIYPKAALELILV